MDTYINKHNENTKESNNEINKYIHQSKILKYIHKEHTYIINEIKIYIHKSSNI